MTCSRVVLAAARSLPALVGLGLALGCSESGGGGGTPPPTAGIAVAAGDRQQGLPGQALGTMLRVNLSDGSGAPAGAGEPVAWTVKLGGGSVTADTTFTAADGSATVQWTLGPGVGGNEVEATWPGTGSVTFHATATGAFAVLGGGNNVPERFSSDLWVADGYGYTGGWDTRLATGNAVKIWQLGPGGAPSLVDSIIVPNVTTISDIQVSEDGQWLVFTTEFGPNHGIHVYQLTTPGHPVLKGAAVAGGFGLHTGTLATIGGKLYAFTAKDPANCALQIYDLSAVSGTVPVASSTPIPDHYCIHDTFVRDGYAFVFAWDEGLYIFDVGNGSRGGSPQQPQLVSHTGSQANPKFGGETHNGWWFWNGVTGEKKYLFIGEEGPAIIGGSASGDIHVVDVSDLNNPVEVGWYSMAGAGTHNFWVDEQAQVLYAAYYNGGVVALDVSGDLSGNLASREIARIRPGGDGNTYVWGVMQYNGSLYASDMLSGFWQLQVP